MEPLPVPPITSSEDEGVQKTQRPASRTALCVRLWEYRGPQEKLHDLQWQSDPSIADLVRSVASEGMGVISSDQDRLVIHFGITLNALAAAKALQVRLLTGPRTPPAAQVVAAAMVHEHAEASSADTEVLTLANMLVEADSAQILVTERVYEVAKDVPGFAFNSKPVHQTGERGFSEPVYELLWTDESTYSHVRKTGQMAVKDVTGASRYQIQSELGRGAMGVVYKAYDQVIGRTVALKTISIQQNFADRSELVERLKQEAKAAGGLDHPNIITIFDVGQEKDFVYLSMQFVEGKTLAALLSSRELPSLSTLLSYADQICAAVGFAHQRGVIHRDLKPANFMLTNEGIVKVLDFGIAKLGDASLTQTGVVVGTPTYMAPEQATGKKLDQRSDIFSLGTVFYELFTREKPFKGDITAVLYKLIHEDPAPPSVINPSLPNGIDAIVRKAMAKKPQDRYQTCEEMREAFRAQVVLLEASGTGAIQSVPAKPGDGTPITTRSAAALKTHSTQKRSSSGSLGWVAVLALLALGGAAGWGYRVKSQTGSLPPLWQKVAKLAPRVKAQVPSNNPVSSTPATTAMPATPEPAAPSNVAAGGQPETGTTAVDAPTTSPAASAPIAAVSNTAVTPASAPTLSQNSDAGAVAVSATVQPSTQPPPTPVAITAVEPTKGLSTAQPEPAVQAGADASEGTEADSSESTPSKSARGQVRRRLAESADSNVRVEGFSRADIPDLLRKADAAAGSGDYALARYEYGIILRLAPHNGAARNGLARVIAARQERFQR
ncbi:MAG TPA: protein kinase [Terriglobales bacterium]|nr:protein kinase [Terriglobales bacterium]